MLGRPGGIGRYTTELIVALGKPGRRSPDRGRPGVAAELLQRLRPGASTRDRRVPPPVSSASRSGSATRADGSSSRPARSSSTARSTSFLALPADRPHRSRRHDDHPGARVVGPSASSSPPVQDVDRRGDLPDRRRAKRRGIGCRDLNSDLGHEDGRRAQRPEPSTSSTPSRGPVPEPRRHSFALVVGDLAPRKNVSCCWTSGRTSRSRRPGCGSWCSGIPGPHSDETARRLGGARSPGIAPGCAAPGRDAALVLRARDGRALPHAGGRLRLPGARGIDVPRSRCWRAPIRRSSRWQTDPRWSCTSTRPPVTWWVREITHAAFVPRPPAIAP